jgi:hypothetical protein
MRAKKEQVTMLDKSSMSIVSKPELAVVSDDL